jgi:predicted DNA-binding WGR domain protein
MDGSWLALGFAGALMALQATRKGSRAVDLDALIGAAKKKRGAVTGWPQVTRLEYVKGSSSKFWEGWVSGTTFHARWGRIGKTGQSGSWEYASESDALARLNQKVSEKLRKGYFSSY